MFDVRRFLKTLTLYSRRECLFLHLIFVILRFSRVLSALSPPLFHYFYLLTLPPHLIHFHSQTFFVYLYLSWFFFFETTLAAVAFVLFLSILFLVLLYHFCTSVPAGLLVGFPSVRATMAYRYRA